MKHSKVSDELNETLNHITGEMLQESDETKSFLTDHQKNSQYRRCTWYNGCYYCQNSNGYWYLVYCIA